MIVLKDNDCMKRYGQPVEGKQPKQVKTYPIPAKIKHGIAAFKKVNGVTLNEDCKDKLFAAFDEIVDAGLGSEIVEWGGALCVRKIRGYDNEWSIHSFGLAFDINMKTNPLGATPALNPKIVAIFKKHGFDWGGDWKRKDGMHFQLSVDEFNKLK